MNRRPILNKSDLSLPLRRIYNFSANLESYPNQLTPSYQKTIDLNSMYKCGKVNIV